MGPGTKWRPFKISEIEYQELVQALVSIDPQAERAQHPYIYFTKTIVNEELHTASDRADWFGKVHLKYHNT